MRRIAELDALRGLAAVAIVIFHLWLPTFGFLGTGVDLFFVMSGYLITTIILRQRDRPRFLATFYARRSLRIWPIYYASLLAFVAINLAGARPAPLDALPLYLAYFQNLPEYWGAANPAFPPGFSHTWSLAVEEQYYLLWPIALAIGGRRAIVPLAVALIAAAVSARMAGFTNWILLTKCDGLALGGWLAAALEGAGATRPDPRASRRVLMAVGVAAVAFLAFGRMALARAGWDAGSSVSLSLRLLAVNLMYVAAIGLIVLGAGRPWLAWLRGGWLVELGQMSYGIYLYHYPLFHLIDARTGPLDGASRVAIDLVKVGGAFGMALLSWRYFEKPLLGLKDRFAYRGPSASASTAEPVVAGRPRLEISGSGA